jgi:hypothetical protein
MLCGSSASSVRAARDSHTRRGISSTHEEIMKRVYLLLSIAASIIGIQLIGVDNTYPIDHPLLVT